MPRRQITVVPDDDRTHRAIAELRKDLEVPESYPQAAIDSLISDPPHPDHDLTDIPFETIDPPGAMDLDQAIHLEKTDDGGYLFHYAIADVARYIEPGSRLDEEAWERGATLYGPVGRVPLHPASLVEGEASLLPERTRVANVWEIRLDGDAEPVDVSVRSARVRSIRRRTYEEVQGFLDDGGETGFWPLVLELGRARRELEIARGGVSLPIPDQEVRAVDGGYGLIWDAPRPIDEANAQLSLLTGAVAAQLMMDGGVGILRTLPESTEEGMNQLRRVAKGLGIDWSGEETYGDLLRRLKPDVPEHLAMLTESTMLFRGAGYQVVGDGAPHKHGALSMYYTHVTAPIRRLVDRYTGAICVALSAGEEPPKWAVDALHRLPPVMADADRRAGQFERAGLDLVEALLLEDNVGETFSAVVVESYDKGGEIMVREPPIHANVNFKVELGETIDVELSNVDVTRRTVSFRAAG